MLGTLRRAVDRQHRRRGRHDVQDADERLLADVTRPAARERQQRCADGGESKSVRERGRANWFVAIRERHGGAQRRQLRQREICEHDAPPQDMHAEIRRG